MSITNVSTTHPAVPVIRVISSEAVPADIKPKPKATGGN